MSGVAQQPVGDSTRTMDMKIEAIILPVADVDRAKSFYAGLGWREDADLGDGVAFRIVQLTPPGSACSIQFGKGVTSAAPGSVQGLYLVVSDIEAAAAQLAARGVNVGDVYHVVPGQPPAPGRDPQGRSYASFANFKDPDGNEWRVQEITQRLPGR